jgi:hypothetical protein
MSATIPSTFYKLEIQGIVYLVDPVTTIAHTYDLTNPTPIGRLLWSSPAELPRISLFDDWEARLAAKKMTWAGYPNGSIPTHDNALSPAAHPT